MKAEEIKDIVDIRSWSMARRLANSIWELTQHGTFSKDWDLARQINRSAGSAMDNIAEGFGRGGNKELLQFLSVARGSAQETKSQLYRALDRRHLTKEDFEELLDMSAKLTIMMTNWMEVLERSGQLGSKFRHR
ncbi:MAG: four helix bundle protein [Lewinella sp.]|nr:four helix bundle protein [Lewinella sp.]